MPTGLTRGAPLTHFSGFWPGGNLPDRFRVAIADVRYAVTVNHDRVGKLEHAGVDNRLEFAVGGKFHEFPSGDDPELFLSVVAQASRCVDLHNLLRISAGLGHLDDAMQFQVGHEQIALRVDDDVHGDADLSKGLALSGQRLWLAGVVEAINVPRRAVAGQQLAVAVERNAANRIQRRPEFLAALEQRLQLLAVQLPDAGQVTIRDEQRAGSGSGDGKRIIPLCGVAADASQGKCPQQKPSGNNAADVPFEVADHDCEIPVVTLTTAVKREVRNDSGGETDRKSFQLQVLS